MWQLVLLIFITDERSMWQSVSSLSVLELIEAQNFRAGRNLVTLTMVSLVK